MVAAHWPLVLQLAVQAPAMQFGLAGFFDAHSASPVVPAVHPSQRLLRQMGVEPVHIPEPAHWTHEPALQKGLLASRPAHCESPALPAAQALLHIPALQNGVPGSRVAHALSPAAPGVHTKGASPSTSASPPSTNAASISRPESR